MKVVDICKLEKIRLFWLSVIFKTHLTDFFISKEIPMLTSQIFPTLYM